MLANFFKISSDAETKHDGFQWTLEACEVKDLVHIIYDILILEFRVFFLFSQRIIGKRPTLINHLVLWWL